MLLSLSRAITGINWVGNLSWFILCHQKAWIWAANYVGTCCPKAAMAWSMWHMGCRRESRGWRASAGFVINFLLLRFFRELFLGFFSIWEQGILVWFTQNLDYLHLKSSLVPHAIYSPSLLNEWQVIYSRDHFWVNKCDWPQWNGRVCRYPLMCRRLSLLGHRHWCDSAV